MIFSIDGHIQQVIVGTKTQTRRLSDRYKVGNTYAVQPGRTEPGIDDGRIKILGKVKETFDDLRFKCDVYDKVVRAGDCNECESRNSRECNLKIVLKQIHKMAKNRELNPHIHLFPGFPITKYNAEAEGGYTPEQFEGLFEEMHPGWETRIAYRFKFIPAKEVK